MNTCIEWLRLGCCLPLPCCQQPIEPIEWLRLVFCLPLPSCCEQPIEPEKIEPQQTEIDCYGQERPLYDHSGPRVKIITQFDIRE